MKTKWIILIAFIVIVASGAAAYYLSNDASGGEDGSRVDFIGANGGVTTVYVEIADTAQEQAQGLMNRETLDQDRGMLFIFEGDYQRSFWMKNTLLPLDMVFVDSQLNIVDINHNATPLSETIFTSKAPCKYVVEVNGGYCEAHGIGIGDRIKLY